MNVFIFKVSISWTAYGQILLFIQSDNLCFMVCLRPSLPSSKSEREGEKQESSLLFLIRLFHFRRISSLDQGQFKGQLLGTEHRQCGTQKKFGRTIWHSSSSVRIRPNFVIKYQPERGKRVIGLLWCSSDVTSLRKKKMGLGMGVVVRRQPTS